MILNEELNKVKDMLKKKMPKEGFELLEDFIKELKESGHYNNAIMKGDNIPGFSLPDAKNEIVESVILLAKGPLVISFYRGAWCPYCNMEIQALQMALPEIHDLGAELIAISPNLPDQSLTLEEKYNLEYKLLSDLGNKVARSFGLVYSIKDQVKDLFKMMEIDIPKYNGDDSWELPIPATYVVDQDGIIISYVNPDWTKRLEISEIIQALKNIQM